MTLFDDTFVYWEPFINTSLLSTLAIVNPALSMSCRSVARRRRVSRLKVRRKVWGGFWKPNTAVALRLWWFDNKKWQCFPLLYGLVAGPLPPFPCAICGERCRSINVSNGILPIIDANTGETSYRRRLHHISTKALRLGHSSKLANIHIGIAALPWHIILSFLGEEKSSIKALVRTSQTSFRWFQHYGLIDVLPEVVQLSRQRNMYCQCWRRCPRQCS